ncbi:hypothetical protein [Mobiluncus sp.]|nr:hypothetical protein [Mobiluncus sp.]
MRQDFGQKWGLGRAAEDTLAKKTGGKRRYLPKEPETARRI